ncbi:MAG: hypothetical protein K2L16_07635 [Muribaculaceae bacterium]|nr:hypothetical protein [Muribaculaceae bacterium]
MLKSFVYLVLLTATIFLIGCTDFSAWDADAELSSPEPSYHARACDLMVENGDMGRCIELQEKAVDELRRGENRESALEILSQMGYIYARNGEFLKSLMYLQEASDSLRMSGKGQNHFDDNETVAAIKLLGNTSNLYIRMGLYNEALALSDRAMALTGDSTVNLRSDLLRMRAVIYDHMTTPDSAIVCKRQALEAARSIADPEERQFLTVRSENEIAWWYIEHPDYMPDSIAGALAVLERNIGKSCTVPTDSLLIGRAYALLGNHAKGISIMKSMIPVHRNRGTENFEFAMQMLSVSLVENALDRHDYEIYRETCQLTDSTRARLTANALLGADFRYRTSQIQRDRDTLKTELSLTRQRNTLLWVIAFMILAIAVTAVFLRIRQKNTLLRIRQAEIESLLREQIRLNTEIEKMRTGAEQGELAAEPGNTVEVGNDDAIDCEEADNEVTDTGEESDSSKLHSMVLLTQTDEARFRRLFAILNPGFIEHVRSLHPDISPSAELVLMLIRLRKSNEEIALVLGIKRESVNKARYRLRMLFGLPKETELNDFIARL